MSKPVRLHKVDDAQPFYNSLEAWLDRHAILLLTILFFNKKLLSKVNISASKTN